MEKRKNDLLIEILVEKVEQLKIDLSLANFHIEQLKEENEALKKRIFRKWLISTVALSAI